MTAEEMSELMYKPLPGEWGERSREEECDRIITGIDRLITVGVYLDSQYLSFFSHLLYLAADCFYIADGDENDACNRVFSSFLQTNWTTV